MMIKPFWLVTAAASTTLTVGLGVVAVREASQRRSASSGSAGVTLPAGGSSAVVGESTTGGIGLQDLGKAITPTTSAVVSPETTASASPTPTASPSPTASTTPTATTTSPTATPATTVDLSGSYACVSSGDGPCDTTQLIEMFADGTWYFGSNVGTYAVSGSTVTFSSPYAGGTSGWGSAGPADWGPATLSGTSLTFSPDGVPVRWERQG